MIGSRLAHFEITARLGKGGMGEVYRATDTKLGREVAIKVLPVEMASDSEWLERFRREARVLASLSHPEIASVFEIGSQDEVHFLVMELIEGETLADLIARGPVPVAEAIDIAMRIARGLEAAHERGVVHRDLKPANVKMTHDGGIKILDFGLAKALDADAGTESDLRLSHSPTLASPATRAGTLLGTAAYMSPEQARGKRVDRRADIWAFGVVFFEMLTGASPFAADTFSDTMAAVLTRTPDLDELPAATPPHVRWLISRCLDPAPDTRLRDIGEARVCLAAESSPTIAAETGDRHGSRTSWPLVSLLIAVTATLGALLGWWIAPKPPPPELRKVDIVLPSQLPQYFQATPRLAPDGSRVLLGSESGLYVRRLDRTENRFIPGSEQTLYSAWAPDSRQIAFVTPGQLWRARADGSSPVPIAALPDDLVGAGGMVWTNDDQIVIGGSSTRGLVAVPAGGGTIREIAPLDLESERDFHEVSLLPNGAGYLVSVHEQGGIANRIDVVTGNGRKTILTIAEGWLEQPTYSPPGYILFSKGTSLVAELWAFAFSLERLEPTGEPFLVSSDGAFPSISNGGTLSFIRGHRVVLRQPLRLTKNGQIERELARTMPGARYPDLSPDGKKLVISAFGTQTYDLVMVDTETQTTYGLTTGVGVESTPSWSPDARSVVYTIQDRDQVALVEIDRPEQAKSLVEGWNGSWLPDGKSIVFEQRDETTGRNIWRHRVESAETERILATPANESFPRVSPDGRWMAYVSDETGRNEVFVREYPDGERSQVSRSGASEPRWGASDELLFRSGNSLYRARRIAADRPSFEEPKPFLSLSEGGFSTGEGTWTTAPDGSLVVLRDVLSEDAAVLTLVTNWWLEFASDRKE